MRDWMKHTEDVEMTEVENAFNNIQEMTPFPLIQVEKDGFDNYLSKYTHSKYKYMLAFVANECGAEVEDITCELANYESKYASDIWIGQEELYSQLDDVLHILMQEPKHKVFLQKVTTKEAPDYARIIKNPMDLSKINKKLKNCIYKSKMEFNEDILLIVENCLLYNADMGSIYRSFAYSLKDRSELLLKEVPDILIKHINTLTEEELRKWKQERSNLFLQRNKMEKINIPPLTFDPLGVIQ